MEELKDYEDRDNPYAWVHPAEPPSRCGLKYSPQSFRRLAAIYAILSGVVLLCMLPALFMSDAPYLPGEMWRGGAELANMPVWYLAITNIAAVGVVILELVMIYRSYAILQGTLFVRLTPGMAILGGFIPIFNIFWTFAAPIWLAQGMNAYCRRHEIEDGSGVPYQVPLWLVVLACASFFVIPIYAVIFEKHTMFGPWYDVSTFILMIPVMFYYGNAAARIQEARLRER